MSHKNDTAPLHIAMYPWLGMSHVTSFISMGNKLAERGHKISIFLPPKTQQKIAREIRYPNLITFITLDLPHVEGLSREAETTNDIPAELRPLLMTAIDSTKDITEAHLVRLKPDFVFYDFVYWLPELARKHGIKSMYLVASYLMGTATTLSLAMTLEAGKPITKTLLTSQMFSSPLIKMYAHEANIPAMYETPDFGGGMCIHERLGKSLRACDAVGVMSSKEMERTYCEYIVKHLGKSVFFAGHMRPDARGDQLDAHLDNWLAGFDSGSVVYCALGSECTLEKAQFDDLVLGLELTGRPFLAALKPPRGYETIESALPDGFESRTKGRGIVYGGWVQQNLILQHPSIGCFITHCGTSSLAEAFVNKCQLVLIPQFADQFITARVFNFELKVGVEVAKRDDDGFFTRESVYKAVKTVMDEDNQVGIEIRANHAKWREFILDDGIEESFISRFVVELKQLLK